MLNLPDKFELTRSENIDLMKSMWDRAVYFGMKMENRNVTFPDTQSILNNINIPNASRDDIQSIINMRDAWKHLFDKANKPITLRHICGINRIIAFRESVNWGVLRDRNVWISASVYRPIIPVKENVINELNDVLNFIESDTQKSLHLFLWTARRQLFHDGNKRTALMLANKYLLQKGRGMFFLDDKILVNFSKVLTAFYETNEYQPAIDFLYNHGIIGKADMDSKPRK
jgi:Fic family protein